MSSARIPFAQRRGCPPTSQALLQADLGATTTFQIIEDLRQTAKSEDRRLEPDDIKSVLRATLIQVWVRRTDVE